MSDNSMQGKFELLVKRYDGPRHRAACCPPASFPFAPTADLRGQLAPPPLVSPGGAASQWLHNLAVGAPVAFKHISFNIKPQYPFGGKKTVTLVCAGTGPRPCILRGGSLWRGACVCVGLPLCVAVSRRRDCHLMAPPLYLY